MALQLFLGSSGSGKSHTIYHKIIEESQKFPEKEYIILVPEQFTMQTQRELVSMHPRGGILNIDVLSFQRLSWRIFQEVGGDDRPILEETGKTLVLEKVIQENRKNLKYLGSQIQKPGCIQEMKSLISELIQYDVGREEMEEMLKSSQGQVLLHHKMEDVQVLYREFRKYLEDRFLTGEEVLEVLCRKLGQSEKIKNTTLVLDGFTGFTPVQYKVLEQLMSLCPNIYVTVTLGEEEDPFKPGKSYQLFAMSKEMIQNLGKLAVKTGTLMEEPRRILAGEHSRFAKKPALGHLEANLFRYRKQEYPYPTNEIQIFSAGNPLGEMKEVSRRIAKLVRENNYRYGDIGVITGDLETYENYVRQAFGQAEIPFFLDRKHSLLMNPFVEFIRSALGIMEQNFSYESLFRHFRCGMLDLSQEEVDRLENYVVALGIRGRKQWEETWVRLYSGMKPEEILEINEIRKKAMGNLLLFADDFKKRGNTVFQDTKALYEYIARENIQEKLWQRKLWFAKAKDPSMEKEYEQIYGIIISLLEKMVEILGDDKISQKSYIQLVEAGLSEASVGIIPPSTDQVLVGDMERTRLKDIKALFFVGVNDGIIPKNTEGGGLLSEPDREFFQKQGISLAPTPREAMYRQRFYLYLNMTRPQSQLCLSYSQANAKGEVLGPAYLIGTILHLFPEIKVEDTLVLEHDMSRFQRPADSRDSLIEGMSRILYQDPGQDWKELYHWYASRPEYNSWCRQMADAVFYSKPKDKISQSVAKALYGTSKTATRLERFAACAFSHFLRYGLSLRERPIYEFTPADMGNVIHKSLEEFSGLVKKEGLDWRELTQEQSHALVEQSLQAVTGDYGNTILHSSARNEYMIQRVTRIMERTVLTLQEQLTHGEFMPEGIEVSVGGGRIDRLDVWETEDKVYVKIIDYKTGGTTFDLLAIYHGLQLQLMVYLDGALKAEKQKHPNKEIVPAGVFYYHVQDPMIQVKAKEDLDRLEEQIRKKMKMSGLVSSEKTVLHKLDSTLQSLPVSLNKGGSFSKYSKVADPGQFKQLGEYVEKKIKDLSERIDGGEVEIAPYELDKKQGCTYCPYKSVCGFDQKIPGFEFRRLKRFSDEEIWAAMNRKEE